GSITFARYLDAVKIADFAEITHLTLDIYDYTAATLPEDVARAKARLDAGDATVVTPHTDNLIAGYTYIKDVYEKPILILRVETPRPIYAQGTLTLDVYLLLGGIALLVFGIIMIGVLDMLVTSRVERLSKDVEKINDAHDLTLHLSAGEPDEIGRLAATINQMLAWLTEAREGEAASRREIVNLLDELKKGKEQAEEMARILAKKAEEK
ncbi:MAG TPA: HAMP domain-containing protein, partial [Candidatus Paceibacterota bacterium]|nr:HAMP domain-containing protein [Candidatus Paceibacterota bacterium]